MLQNLSAGLLASPAIWAYVLGNPLKLIDPSGHYACGDGEDVECGSEQNSTSPTGCLACIISTGDQEIPWGTTQSHDDHWFDLGFDWLLQHGPDERQFDDDDYMTQILKNHPGVNAARERYRSGTLRSGEIYEHDFDEDAFMRAWRLPIDGTAHFLGSYYVRIDDNGDGSAIFSVTNQSDWASASNFRDMFGADKTQDFSLVERVQQALDCLCNPGPVRTLFPDVPRDRTWFGLGGNFLQIYTWTEPLSVDAAHHPR